MERDLTFQGLIVFRNELRDDSAATIAKLKVSAANLVCGVPYVHSPHGSKKMRRSAYLTIKQFTTRQKNPHNNRLETSASS